MVLISRNKLIMVLTEACKLEAEFVGMHPCLMCVYEGGSICNENPFITPSPNALGFYDICQTKDQRIAFIMVQKTLFYLSKFNKLQTF